MESRAWPRADHRFWNRWQQSLPLDWSPHTPCLLAWLSGSLYWGNQPQRSQNPYYFEYLAALILQKGRGDGLNLLPRRLRWPNPGFFRTSENYKPVFLVISRLNWHIFMQILCNSSFTRPGDFIIGSTRSGTSFAPVRRPQHVFL